MIWVWPWYSPAVPVTRTTSPRLTVFALLPSKTKMPSDVAGLPSPAGSWMKKPRRAGDGALVVADHDALGGAVPVSATVAPLPWMAGIGVNGCAQTSNVLKPTVKSMAMLSGGSLPS